MSGRELKAWRKKWGLSQTELAQCLGVTRITVTRWETEVRAVPPFLHWALEAMENRLRKGGKEGLMAEVPGEQR